MLSEGKIVDWDYYTYVRNHPIDFEWSSSIDILYGLKDTIIAKNDILEFSRQYDAKLMILEEAEHFFSTEEQLESFDIWLNQCL